MAIRLGVDLSDELGADEGDSDFACSSHWLSPVRMAGLHVGHPSRCRGRRAGRLRARSMLPEPEDSPAEGNGRVRLGFYGTRRESGEFDRWLLSVICVKRANCCGVRMRRSSTWI